MFRAKCLFFLFFFFSIYLSAEEDTWIIAAAPFATVDVSPVYENLSTIIPELILSRISSIGSRLVMYDEEHGRKIKTMEDDRLALIRERASLIEERDKIFFSIDSESDRRQAKKDANVKIKAKEKEIRKLNDKIDTVRLEGGSEYTNTAVNITLWNSGEKLYTKSGDVSLRAALRKDAISGLITGTIEDIAGYIYVTAQIETGISDIPVVTVSDITSYDDIDSLVTYISSELLPEVACRTPVSLNIHSEPETARVFIDNRLIPDTTEPIVVFSGEHTITVSADGYKTSIKTAAFENASNFNVDIALEELPTVSVRFDTDKLPASLFLHTQYFGELPTTVTVPAIPTIGEIVKDDITTWFVFAPEQLSDDRLTLVIKQNKEQTEKLVEKRRDILYWSLAALYISLPVTLFSTGIKKDAIRAYEDGRITQVDNINKWSTVSLVSSGISIGCGVNFIVQLTLYILAANQTMPQYASSE